MIDANSQFFAILTNVGMAKQANADALGIPWKITEMSVGDANGTDPIPSATQTKLINEWRRRPLNQLKVDPNNPAVIIAEQVIPADEGGKWIREIGLYDAEGDLVAVANCAPSFKPVLSQGSGRTQVVRMNFIVTGTGNITLKIDPSVVLATREYVELAITEAINKLDFKASLQVATTASIALNGLQVVDGVSLLAGARVLVKNQAQAKDNGLWVVATGAWTRAQDADATSEVSPGMIVVVEEGATQADTLWQLITDGPINLGVTALNFKNVTAGFAPIDSPLFVGIPRAPTPAQFDVSTKLATMEALQRALGGYRGEYGVSASMPLTALHVGQIGFIGGVGGYTITLPPTASLLAGVTISLNNRAAADVTTVAAAGGQVNAASGVLVDGLLVRPGGTAELYWNGAVWIVYGGSEAMRYAGLAGLDSPFFLNTPKAPTPPQFDTSSRLATMEAVQRSQGNFRGEYPVSSSFQLTGAHVGQVGFITGAGGFTVTLPATAGLGVGSVISFFNGSTGSSNVVSAAGAAIHSAQGVLAGGAPVRPGSSLVLYWNGTAWLVFGGTEALRYDLGAFGASFGTTCVSKSPNGQILMWGEVSNMGANTTTVVTLPSAFPTAYKNFVSYSNDYSPATLGEAPGSVRTSLSQLTIGNGCNAPESVSWLAVGY